MKIEVLQSIDLICASLPECQMKSDEYFVWWSFNGHSVIELVIRANTAYVYDAKYIKEHCPSLLVTDKLQIRSI